MKKVSGIAKANIKDREALCKLLRMEEIPDGSNVLLGFLGHPRFIKLFKDTHPNSKVLAVEDKGFSWLYQDTPYNIKLIEISKGKMKSLQEVLEGNHFDYAVTCPPHKGNLHLQILTEVLKYSDKIFNISPDDYRYDFGDYITWDPYLIDNLFKHEIYHETFPEKTSTKLFDFSDLMGTIGFSIFEKSFTNGPKFWEKEKILIPKLISIRKDNLRKHFINRDLLSENGQRLFRFHRNSTCAENSYLCDKGQAVEGIDFSTAKEKENFRKSIGCWPYKFLYSINDKNPSHAPFVGSMINPRTGQIGYKSEWIDEDFYILFNFSNKEKEIIEEVINKFELLEN